VRHTEYVLTRHITYAYLLTATAGKSVVLRDGRGGRMGVSPLVYMPNPEINADFLGASEWGPTIQQAVTDVCLPKELARLQAGERLDFDPLWLTQQEIGSRSRDRAVPWRSRRCA
jgi:hypothetical protein